MEGNSIALVLDCKDPSTLAKFWAPALGYVEVGDVENFTLLLPDGVPGFELLLQRVPEDKAGKNRMHLDIHTADIEAEAARLAALGASRLAGDQVSEHGHSWVLMADPEGNEFCVCDL